MTADFLCLRVFEEQQHRQFNYSFGLTGNQLYFNQLVILFLGTKAEAADFSVSLRHLTSGADTEDYISPAIIDEEQVKHE